MSPTAYTVASAATSCIPGRSSSFAFEAPTWFWIFALVALLVLVLLVLQWLNHTRRITEARLKTVEALAREGMLDRAELARLTESPRYGRRIIYFLAWLAMLGGIFCFMMSGFVTRGSDAYVMRGVVLSFVATAIFSTPVLFREIEKQGWI